MPHSTTTNQQQAAAGRRWISLFTFILAMSVGLVPLACTPSTADSAQEDESSASTSETDATEEASYDIPDYTGDRTVAQRLNDASLAARITQALVRQRDLRIFDFSPQVDGATVTLRGDVNTRDQWRQVEQVAQRAAGGRTLVNEVTIGGRPADEVAGNEGAAKQDDGPASAVYHTVQRGESLWQIARQYGASVQRIRGLNNLSSDNLSVGQRIRVR